MNDLFIFNIESCSSEWQLNIAMSPYNLNRRELHIDSSRKLFNGDNNVTIITWRKNILANWKAKRKYFVFFVEIFIVNKI